MRVLNFPSPERPLGKSRRRLIAGVLLSATVAFGLTWAGKHVWRTQRQNCAIDAVHQLHGHLEYAHEAFGAPPLPGPLLLRCLIGEQYFFRVSIVNLGNKQTTDAVMASLAGLTELRELTITDTPITGSGLAFLHESGNLRILGLSNTRTTSAQLKHLQAFPQLRELYLDRTCIEPGCLHALQPLLSLEAISLAHTAIGDDDIECLVKFSQLAWLRLDDTHITDACLDSLMQLKRLKELSVRNTSLTSDGIRRLHEILPNATID